jgi:hypothetical protein
LVDSADLMRQNMRDLLPSCCQSWFPILELLSMVNGTEPETYLFFLRRRENAHLASNSARVLRFGPASLGLVRRVGFFF